MILVAVALLASRTIDNEIPFYDDGVYLINAKSLALGFGYRNLHLPDAPPQGKYPPLFPSLLSLLWHFFPDFPENLKIMKALILTMGVAFLAVAYAYLRTLRQLGEICSAFVVAMVALHPLFLELTVEIMSDIPYALLSMLAILFYRTFVIKEALLPLAIAAAFAAAAFLTRSIGIVLLGAMGIHLLLMKKYRLSLGFAALNAAVVIPWFLWSSTARAAYSHYPPEIAINYTDYLANWFLADGIFSVLRSLAVNFGYLIINCASFILPWAYPFIGGTLAMTVLYYFARNFRQQPGLHDIYCMLTLIVILFWPWPVNDRFLLAISPFLIAYWFMGVRLILFRLLPKRLSIDVLSRIWSTVIVVVLTTSLAHNFVAYRKHQEIRRKLVPIYMEFHRMLEWIKHNTPANAIVVAHDDPLYYLFAERKAIRISYADPFAVSYTGQVKTQFPRAGKLLEWFKQADACYVSQNPLSAEGQRLYYSNLIQALKRVSPNTLVPIYTGGNGWFVLYRIQGCPPKGG